MIYERIKELCEKNGISVNALEKEMSIARGSLCKIDKHKPSSERIQTIANRLNSTERYIMTGEEPEFSVEMAQKDLALSNMSERIKDYALILNDMPSDQQEHIISLIDMLNKNNK